MYRYQDGNTVRASWFLASAEPATARKNWIGGHLAPSGKIHLDAGAVRALEQGNSLLPAGVKNLEGDFDRGDIVLVIGPDGAEIGRGIISYPASEARQILGKKSDEIEVIIGYAGRDELIHRDDFVLIRRPILKGAS